MTTFLSSRLSKQCAFGRLDAVACLAGLALLVSLSLPALAVNRTRSERFVCLNNLRQLGVALQLWGGDHEDLPPWEIPPNRGGTYGHSLAPNVWLHLSWLSNEVATPRIFLCPSDTGLPAKDFSGDPDGGYLHPNFRHRATSYSLSHAFNNTLTVVVAGDRNVTLPSSGGCSRFGAAFTTPTQPGPSISWSDGLHGVGAGNLLRLDGSSAAVDNAGLRTAISSPRDDNGSFHLILPR